MSNLSPRALALYQAHGPGPVDWERMVRVVDRAVEMSRPAWMPIETAPKDGRPILAWDPYYLMRCVKPDTTSGSWLTDLPSGRERGEREMRVEPTHWIPLPTPPSDREKTDREAVV